MDQGLGPGDQESFLPEPTVVEHKVERYAVRCLLRALTRLETRSRLPINVTAETERFAESLLPFCDTPEKPLFNILLEGSHGRLDDALLHSAVPIVRLAPLIRLREAYESLQLQKEAACRDQEFERARQCLTEQGDVLAEIARLEPKRIDLMPQNVIGAIRLLAYAGELPPP